MVLVGPFQLNHLTQFCPVLPDSPGAMSPHRDLILHPQPLENLISSSCFQGDSATPAAAQQGGESTLAACFEQENPYMVGKFVKGRIVSISDRVST